MVLNNMVNKKKESGFTLVELLIVIVIIAILAAITIVAYSGITARAYTSKSQANAESAQKVAEAMNADNGYYPALAATGTTACSATPAPTTTCLTLGSTSTKLPSGMTVIPDNIAGTLITATTATNGTTVAYSCLTVCSSTTGGRIAYWNFTTNQVNYDYVGAGTSAGVYAAPAN
jgi:type IV pilus assembly protein PilA